MPGGAFEPVAGGPTSPAGLCEFAHTQEHLVPSLARRFPARHAHAVVLRTGSARSPYLSARTRKTRKPRRSYGPGPWLRPADRQTPGGTSNRRGSRGASPRGTASDRPSATSHNSPCRTSPGTTPTRCRACRTIPTIGPLQADGMRHPAGVAVEPAVVRKLGSSYSLGHRAAARTETEPTRAPRRQAYSHCASEGRRYGRPAAFSSGSSDSFRQNSTASSHDTCSTGNRFVSCRPLYFCPCPWPRTRSGCRPSPAGTPPASPRTSPSKTAW